MTKFGLAESKTSKRNNRKEAAVLQMIGAQDQEEEKSQNIVNLFKMLNKELKAKKKISFDPLNLFTEWKQMWLDMILIFYF